MTPSDALVVRRVLRGDVEAFRLLVERYHNEALRFATRLLGDAADAEDAVQETFVRAYRYLGSYREQDRFRGWLWRILVNRCRTVAGDRSKRTQQHGDTTQLLYDQYGVSPENELDRVFLRDELARALQALPVEQREAVILHFTDGLSYPEMSDVTGVGVSALKMRVSRACARLRALLAPTHLDPDPFSEARHG